MYRAAQQVMSEFQDLFEELSEHGLVLCALSKKRLELLQSEPTLVDDLLDARHEQPVPGLLDLGQKGASLVKLLLTGTPELADSLLARSGVDIDDLPARIIRATEVKKLSVALLAVHPRWIQERVDAIGPAGKGLVEAFQEVQKLYAEASKRDDSMLIVIE
jgi:hypothetical protein